MDNHKIPHVSVILMFFAILLSLCLVFVGAVAMGTVPKTFYWGIPFGFVFVFLSRAYLNVTWDPANMRPKSKNSGAKTLQERWIVFFVLLGIGSIRILPNVIGRENAFLVAGCMSSWLFLTITYMMIQLWRHRQ